MGRRNLEALSTVREKRLQEDLWHHDSARLEACRLPCSSHVSGRFIAIHDSRIYMRLTHGSVDFSECHSSGNSSGRARKTKKCLIILVLAGAGAGTAAGDVSGADRAQPRAHHGVAHADRQPPADGAAAALRAHPGAPFRPFYECMTFPCMVKQPCRRIVLCSSLSLQSIFHRTHLRGNMVAWYTSLWGGKFDSDLLSTCRWTGMPRWKSRFRRTTASPTSTLKGGGLQICMTHHRL